jgi:hypothetical protein
MMQSFTQKSFTYGEHMRSTSLRSATSAVFVVIAASLLSTVMAYAQGTTRKAAPTGQEIAQKAKATKLDRAHATVAELKGKKIVFTPADLHQVKHPTELEAGRVIGTLETEAVGDETGLPPGNYHVFVAKVGDQWHAYAEAGGVVVKEAVRVRMERAKDRPLNPKPEFREEGWCFSCWVMGEWEGFWRWAWTCW